MAGTVRFARPAVIGVMKPSKSALFDSAKRWDAPAVVAILKAAPGLVHATDPKGRTALHIACAVPPSPKLGEPDGIKTVTALLKTGADLEAHVPMPAEEGDFRANAVWYAASRGENLALVKFLLKRGGDPSYSLWTAVFRDNTEMFKALLAAKPRLNLRAHGETPIFYAARTQRLKTLDLLIKAGADPRIEDDRGRDTVEIAKARRLPKDVIARLEKLRTST
jgi:ankyrin repeat protein